MSSHTSAACAAAARRGARLVGAGPTAPPPRRGAAAPARIGARVRQGWRAPLRRAGELPSRPRVCGTRGSQSVVSSPGGGGRRMTERGAGGLRVIAWLASPGLLAFMGWLAGLRLNLTGSLPVGLYVISPSLPVRGALVLACLPAKVAAFAHARGYVPRGEGCPNGVAPIGKPVAAIAGDTVAVTPAGLFVNGVAVPNSQALATDRKGRPLARVRVARWVVEAGTIWIVSSYSRFSFDSRYFGPIEVRQVRATLQPLWTAGSDQ